MTWCSVFLSYFIFDLIWFHSDVDKLGSNRKQSPQASTEANKGNVTLWVISALFMNSAQFRVALNSLINWLFKRNSVTFSFLSLFCIVKQSWTWISSISPLYIQFIIVYNVRFLVTLSYINSMLLIYIHEGGRILETTLNIVGPLPLHH